jgi:hypothetical protein
MQGLAHLLSDPWIAGVAVLVVCGALGVRYLGRGPLEGRVRWLRGIWIAAFLALSMWGMRQDQQVRAGPDTASADAPVAVVNRGTTHYVSEAQAFRHGAVLWVILGAGLGFALVEMLVFRRRDPG